MMVQAILPPLLFLAAMATIPATSIRIATKIPEAPLVPPSSIKASPIDAAHDWKKITRVSTMLIMPITSFATFITSSPLFYLFNKIYSKPNILL
jgi:hypothetical protein